MAPSMARCRPITTPRWLVLMAVAGLELELELELDRNQLPLAACQLSGCSCSLQLQVNHAGSGCASGWISLDMCTSALDYGLHKSMKSVKRESGKLTL